MVSYHTKHVPGGSNAVRHDGESKSPHISWRSAVERASSPLPSAMDYDSLYMTTTVTVYYCDSIFSGVQ